MTIAEILSPHLAEPDDLRGCGDELYALVGLDVATKLVRDFVRIRHFPSTALAKLFGHQRRMDRAGGELRLYSIPEELARIFGLVGSHPFRLSKDEEAAIASF